MAANTDLHKQLKSLETVLDEYLEWFLELTKLVFYPVQNAAKSESFSHPQSFDGWLQNSAKTDFLTKDVLKDLHRLHSELGEQAENAVKTAAQEKIIPDVKDYEKLAVLFEQFLSRIRRVEKDCLLEDSGIDVLTGLRTYDVMEKDISREMDRFARQGKTFSIALVRIDNFHDMQKEMKAEQLDKYVKEVAGLIKKSIRSFDDAYRRTDGVFILSLKQTGSSGGVKVLNRLSEELDAAALSYNLEGKKHALTLSSCIGEPSENENIGDFVKNLEKDLQGADSKQGTVLEYYEISPLQRFIKEQNEGQG